MVRAQKNAGQVVLAIVLLAAVYAGAGKLGLELASVHPSATPVWPPTGISLAALLIFGYRLWPGIFLGAFIANLIKFANVTPITEASTAASLAIAVGNTLEALVGAGLVNRFANGAKTFERPQDVFKFTLLAAILSTMVSGAWGVTSVSVAGKADWADFFPIWLTWWLGDAVGALLVAPPLLLWWADPRLRWGRWDIAKAALLLLALAGVSEVVFGQLLWAEGTNLSIGFICLPVLVLVAFQFGQRETASALLLFSGLALWGTLHHFGPFVRRTDNLAQVPNESVLLLQAFLVVSAVTALALAAVVSQYRRAEKELLLANENLEGRVRERTLLLAQVNEALRKKIAQRNQAEKTLMENEERTPRIVETAYDAFIAMNADGGIIDWNAQAEATFGWRRHEVLDQSLAERIIPGRFRDAHRQGL